LQFHLCGPCSNYFKLFGHPNYKVRLTEKKIINTAAHNKIVSFIWSIVDDCLRAVYVRGKYRDIILPMVVLRRLDALLEPTKKAVMTKVVFHRDEAKFTEWDEKG